MNSISFTDVQTKNNGNSKSNNTKAVIAGGAIGLAMPAVLFCDTMRPLSDDRAKSVAKTFSKLMPDIDTFENTKKTAEKILKDTCLESKGVKILYIDDSAASLGKLEEIINKVIKGGFIGDRIRSKFYQMLKHGANAAYADKTNTVIVSAKNLYSSIYHELGHAMNQTAVH